MERLNYLMFENIQNSCWLDAVIILAAHNTTFKSCIEPCPKSRIKNIIASYNEAITILNDNNRDVQLRILKTRKLLRGIQKSTLDYLKPFLKFRNGSPESAFCALLSLICRDDSKIKKNLSVSWIWQKKCDSCGTMSRSKLFTKPIITFQKVNYFHPECPTSSFTCSCKKEQEMKLIYTELSNCLMFHFEYGAGTGSNIPLCFKIDVREYHLTSVIMLEKSHTINVNHFVTWIRDSTRGMWLDCNDLNKNIVKFTEDSPALQSEDIYMCVYEAFDDLGRIFLEISTDEESTENLVTELIYLSDEDEDSISAPNVFKASDLNQNMENEETHLNNVGNDLHDKDLVNNISEGEQTFKMLHAEKSNGVEKHDTIHHQNHCSNSNNCVSASEEFSDIKKHETGVGTTNYQSENVSEIKAETGEARARRETLNKRNKLPCAAIFVDRKDVLIKCEKENEVERVKSSEAQSIDCKVTPAEFRATQGENIKSECFQIVKMENEVNTQNEKNLLLEQPDAVSNELNLEKQNLSLHTDKSSDRRVLDMKCKTQKKKLKTEIPNMGGKTNEAEDNLRAAEEKPKLDEQSKKMLRMMVHETAASVFAKFELNVSRLNKRK